MSMVPDRVNSGLHGTIYVRKSESANITFHNFFLHRNSFCCHPKRSILFYNIILVSEINVVINIYVKLLCSPFRTPMMDLLVQAASATKISPGGHVIHVFGDGDKGNGALHYKPSTPIGSLDTKTICIVPKKEAGDPLARRMGKTANRPFEVSANFQTTRRLQ